MFFGTFIAIFKGGSSKGAEDAKETHKREYYYGVHLLNSNKITKEQYNLGIVRAKDVIKENGTIEHQPDLHVQEK